jgi:hypothetical protein
VEVEESDRPSREDPALLFGESFNVAKLLENRFQTIERIRSRVLHGFTIGNAFAADRNDRARATCTR